MSQTGPGILDLGSGTRNVGGSPVYHTLGVPGHLPQLWFTSQASETSLSSAVMHGWNLYPVKGIRTCICFLVGGILKHFESQTAEMS